MKRRLFVAGALAVALVATASAAAAVIDGTASVRILPGIRIAGVDVGGMTRAEAAAAIGAIADDALGRSVSILAGGARWTTSYRAAGVVADVTASVDGAFAVAGDLGLVARLTHRFGSERVDVDLPLAFSIEDGVARSLAHRIAEALDAPAVDARIAVEEGAVVVVPSSEGIAVRVDEATAALREGLASLGGTVRLPIDITAPAVASGDLGRTIVVDISANTLVLYDGTDVLRRYRVATGAPGYPTPLGKFEIVNKVEDPTWTNPDPEGWGKDYPPFIPAGPGNPLGTRALYLDAPGIRIHGTYSSSSIGTFASHGCIRMLIADSEALYPLVPIGTPVYIVA